MKERDLTPGMFYGERAWFPTWWGFCPTEAVWKEEMARLSCPNEPYPLTDGKCSTFEYEGDDEPSATVIIVTIGTKLDAMDDPAGVVGVIFHEAVHVFQRICQDIGETEPSAEMEAYAVQYIGAHLLQAYVDMRRPDLFGPVAKPEEPADVAKAGNLGDIDGGGAEIRHLHA